MNKKLFLIFILLSVFAQVFSRDYVIVGDISIKGNKRTKEQVILREFTFESGDTLSVSDFEKQLQKTRENIYNLHLFNFVEADTFFYDSNIVNVNITVLERWYVWPIPIVEHAGRNFGAWIYEREWDRVNYGIFLVIDNVRGRNETFMLKIRPGWREQYGFLYSIPALNRKKTFGLEFTFSTFRQKIFLLNTADNKPYYFISDDYCYFQNRAITTFIYRPSLYLFHNIVLTYNDYRITDSPYSMNNDYIRSSKKNAEIVSLSYEPLLEKRNIVSFPTKGYHVGLKLQYSSDPAFKGNVNVWQFGIVSSAFLPAGERFFFATGLDAAFHTCKYESFLFDQAIGYGNYIRGYELYTINGNAYWMQKTALNYNLVKTRVKTFGKEKYHKFLKLHYALYLSAFTDMAYVNSEYHEQTYQNQFHCGYGLGLNLVTYYDWVWRIEYSLNKYGENRVYLHFNLAF